MTAPDPPVQVNTRFLAHELTGVQRYTVEILRRLDSRFERIAPVQMMDEGIAGHLWEQLVLPFRVDDRLFWNPTCPAPLVVSNQVVTVHDLSVIDHPEWFDWKYALWNRLLIPLALRQARHVIAVSEYTKQKICRRYPVPEEKVSVIHNGVDPRFEERDRAEVSAMRSELDLPSGPYLLSLSAIEPRKNLHRLLQVWERMQDAHSNLPTLVLAGGAGRPTIFHNYSIGEVPPNVHFTGYVEDEWLPALYTGAKAFVYPSLYEGFGLPVLEAMACGTAVLTSATTSLPEVTGGAAMLANPFSTQDLHEKLVALLNDNERREHLEHRGRKRAASFNWETTAQQTWDVLCQFL